MNIRLVPLHEIKPYENNVKQHPIRQLQAIERSIAQFGFQQPIVIDKNNIIICGHARYEAAASLGLDLIPCQVAEELTEDLANAYRILDNEIAAKGYTDLMTLKLEMEKLPEFDFTPFNLEEIKLPNIKLDESVGGIKEEKLITCPKCDHQFYEGENV